MGSEAKCRLTFGRTKAEGTALLETDALVFHGADVRLSIPYKQMSRVTAADGALRVTFPGGAARFALGPAAGKWAAKILNPSTRIDKLGIQRGHRVLLAGVGDARSDHRRLIRHRGSVRRRVRRRRF